MVFWLPLVSFLVLIGDDWCIKCSEEGIWLLRLISVVCMEDFFQRICFACWNITLVFFPVLKGEFVLDWLVWSIFVDY